MKKILLFLSFLLMSIGMFGITATMTAGTNGSSATVNGNPAIKVGTSSKGGDMSITIGAGATTLSFYAAAWNNVNDLSLNITAPDGVTVSPTSVDLIMDSGISNNTPFTLNGDESNYLYTVTLTGIDNETVITFTTSSAKRFVIWGADYISQSTYTIKWVANGDTIYSKNASNVDTVPLIDASNYCADMFIGWTNTEYYDTIRPYILFNNVEQSPRITDNTTFYSVFANFVK